MILSDVKEMHRRPWVSLTAAERKWMLDTYVSEGFSLGQ